MIVETRPRAAIRLPDTPLQGSIAFPQRGCGGMFQLTVCTGLGVRFRSSLFDFDMLPANLCGHARINARRGGFSPPANNPDPVLLTCLPRNLPHAKRH